MIIELTDSFITFICLGLITDLARIWVNYHALILDFILNMNRLYFVAHKAEHNIFIFILFMFSCLYLSSFDILTF